mgnify:FL=1
MKMKKKHVVNETKEYKATKHEDTDIVGFIQGVKIHFSISKITNKPVYVLFDEEMKKVLITNVNMDKYKVYLNIFNKIYREEIIDIYISGKYKVK